MKPIEFIKLAGNGGRIVSSNDLTLLQIAEAQACNRFYVDPDTSFGWAVLPWHCTTGKDRSREDAIFNRTLPPEVAAAMERYRGHEFGKGNWPYEGALYDVITLATWAVSHHRKDGA